MEAKYNKGIKYYNEKDYVNALKIFSAIDYLDSKSLENNCIDKLEDLIFYSKRKQALDFLDKLKFYPDYSYFIDAYKRRRLDILSKALMIIPAIIGTTILLIIMLL